MALKLIDTDTGREIPEGSMLHGKAGAVAGQAWRFEGIRETPGGEHPGLLHCTRGARVGRAHRHFPPHLFDAQLEPVIEVSITAHFKASAQQLWTGFVSLVVAGLIAYIVALGMGAIFHV